MNHENNNAPVSSNPLTLRPADLAVALQLTLTPDATYSELAQSVGISTGGAHKAVTRLQKTRLLGQGSRKPNPQALIEFLIHGVPNSFPAEFGAPTKGVPTAYSAPPLKDKINSDQDMVWPSGTGKTYGQSITPLVPSAPELPAANPALYRLLTLTDALRAGRARERELAKELLREELGV